MKALTITIIVLSCFIYSGSFSQSWMNSIDKDKQSEANFYDIQKAFNEYWKGKEI